MRITRMWAMPNSNTFSIKPIAELIRRYNRDNSIDPFANSNRIANVTNDIDPAYGTDYNLDALDFLKALPSNSVDLVLYDPPYSPRQIAECYKKLGKSVNMETTQNSYWADQKNEISRLARTGANVITCGWNSGGIGKKYGFEIIEILMVPHGSWHNDTIVTVEVKTSMF
jgi:hypothetical protein